MSCFQPHPHVIKSSRDDYRPSLPSPVDVWCDTAVCLSTLGLQPVLHVAKCAHCDFRWRPAAGARGATAPSRTTPIRRVTSSTAHLPSAGGPPMASCRGPTRTSSTRYSSISLRLVDRSAVSSLQCAVVVSDAWWVLKELKERRLWVVFFSGLW